MIGLPSFAHISQYLRCFHWLPLVKKKFSCITLRPLFFAHFTQVSCYSFMKSPNDEKNLADPSFGKRTRNGTFGQMCISYSSAAAWNELPNFIRMIENELEFKKTLKSYLSSISFWIGLQFRTLETLANPIFLLLLVLIFQDIFRLSSQISCIPQTHVPYF